MQAGCTLADRKCQPVARRAAGGLVSLNTAKTAPFSWVCVPLPVHNV